MKGKASGATSLLQAQPEFVSLLHFVQEDSQTEAISQVEKQIFSRLLDLGRNLLEVYMAQKGTGYGGGFGSRKMGAGGRVRGFVRGSIFRSLVRSRSGRVTLMTRRKGKEVSDLSERGCPLAQQLHLPERKYSYLLGTGCCVSACRGPMKRRWKI